jgi:hypothetical protein
MDHWYHCRFIGQDEASSGSTVLQLHEQRELAIVIVTIQFHLTEPSAS